MPSSLATGKETHVLFYLLALPSLCCGLLELFPPILLLSPVPTARPIQLFHLLIRNAAGARNQDFSGPVKGFE